MADDTPPIVGLYGLPGSGKTFVLEEMKKKYEGLKVTDVEYFEGSEMLSTLVTGGLEAFKKMEPKDKSTWRAKAIKTIKDRCRTSEKMGVVTGHYTFWSKEEDPTWELAWTDADSKVYSHIIYLDVPPQAIVDRCRGDSFKTRPDLSVKHVERWQKEEISSLRRACLKHCIIFGTASTFPSFLGVTTLFDNVYLDSEKKDIERVKRKISEILSERDTGRALQTVLLIDGDKTLCPEDTSDIFWQQYDTATKKSVEASEKISLEELFSGRMGHSWHAFVQASWMYYNTNTYNKTNHVQFEALCGKVAAEVAIHAEFLSLLRLVAKTKRVRAVVVTCGLQLLWEKILEKSHLSSSVKVIGNGPVRHQPLVMPAIKGEIATYVRQKLGKTVWAFGDSSVDIPMMCEAHNAIVVVGEEATRSKTMDKKLSRAIEAGAISGRQILLPSTVQFRLKRELLPIVQMDRDFLRSILGNEFIPPSVHSAGDRAAAKLLMTPARDASVAGPALRDAHRRIGWYLATDIVAGVVGLEEVAIQHVQGVGSIDHRLLDERRTLIVALMRGGEPMALGVSEAFPLAMFLHAKDPEDVKAHHLESLSTVMLVDSVVNTGASVVGFINRIRHFTRGIRIVIVAGVMQREALSTETGCLASLENQGSLELVTLRTSANEFTGAGPTDTGNRLFNTTGLL